MITVSFALETELPASDLELVRELLFALQCSEKTHRTAVLAMNDVRRANAEEAGLYDEAR